MRRAIAITALLIAGVVPAVSAQESAAERAARLRGELVEVESRSATLDSRLKQIDEDLKPENIERSLAGVGSTRPENLREERRRVLEIEKNGVQSQLRLLAQSKVRLESAIARADAESYHQSAAKSAVVPIQPASQVTVTSGSVAAPTRKVKSRVRRMRRARPRT